MSLDETPIEPPPPRPGKRAGIASALLVYSMLRFGLTVAIAALLTLFAPFLFALIIAVILQLPLSWLLFSRQRAKVNARLAETNANRREERNRLRAQLHGEDLPPDASTS